MDILKSLNPKQRQAVEAINGPVLVIAGPGSGKTRVLTHRVAYLISQGIPPKNILAVTFTNKAASEMKERIKKLIIPQVSSLPKSGTGGQTSLPSVGTFHAICAQILRKEAKKIGWGNDFIIYDDKDSLRLIKKCQEELQISQEQFKPRSIQESISTAKNELLGPEEYISQANGFWQEITGKVYTLYQAKLKQNNAFDFDDLLMMVAVLFQDQPPALAKYQNQWHYILVDEYQDTNRTQAALVSLLAQKHKNIFVVGDFDQCLPAGTLVKTPKGQAKIETIKPGDQIVTAVGKGHISLSRVKRVFKNRRLFRLLTFKTASGKQITATINHKMFCFVPPRQSIDNCFYVYLMHRHNLGWRLGITNDLSQRLRIERSADKIIGLRCFSTEQEARYFEMLLSLRYGIPTVCFMQRKGLYLTNKFLKELYQEIDTDKKAKILAQDLKIDLNAHHFCLAATNYKGVTTRIKIYLDICYRKYTSKTGKQRSLKNPSILHLVSLETSNRQIIKKLNLAKIPLSKAKKGMRVRISTADIRQAGKIAKQLKQLTDGIVEQRFCIGRKNTEHRYALVMPASNILPGHYLPVLGKNNRITYDRITKITSSKKTTTVFDLTVEKTHNFIANGIAVHNSIYMWRGADFKNILNFEKEYPDCQVIILEENYRSTQNILAAAANVISRNIERKEKTLWTKNPEGYPIFFYEARNEKDEGNFIIREVKTLLRKNFVSGGSNPDDGMSGYSAAEINKKISAGGFKLADFAVLYRTNAQSRAIEEAFLMAGLPYKVVGSVKFYDRKEIKDLLAYLRVIQNPQDTVSLERIINMPPRGIGKVSSFKFQVSSFENWTGKKKASWENFNKLILDLRKKSVKLSVTDLLKQIIKETKYQDYILSQANGENRWENIEELFSVTQKYDLLPPEERLKTFLEEASLLQSSDEVETKKDLVNLMTLHCAKGLEFPVVFIIGCEEGIFPHSKSLINKTQMEEERRLCYVGMTRAKKALYLLFAQRRLLFGSTIANPPSRFLSDLPEDLVEVRQNVPEKYFDEDNEKKEYKYF